MIRLHPVPEAQYDCPRCQASLRVAGWYIPGMRNLAEMVCAQCEQEFYGDLRAGQALYTPVLLEKRTGATHDAHHVKWFADWLREAYQNRTSTPLSFEVREHRAVQRKIVLLNCLDALYGHSLLKLLNAQHYIDARRDVDLILMIPQWLEWMQPAGIAQTWVVGLSLRRGTEWNDWLAGEVKRRIEALSNGKGAAHKEVYLSCAFSHPHPNDYDIERFTNVKSFPLDEWAIRLARPAVTFIWREDRLWSTSLDGSNQWRKIKGQIKRAVASAREQQRRNVLALAEALREEWPTLDFAVVGLGAGGDLPAWITDWRQTRIDATTERTWCERYAASHVVTGVHGSNMLLPSAHAGSVVELIGAERWGNFLQDILFRTGDAREMFYRYRFAPDSTPPRVLAQLISFVLRYPAFQELMNPRLCNHEA